MDDGVRGQAIEIEQLVRARTQDGAHFRRQPVDGSLAASREAGIERRLPPKRSRDDFQQESRGREDLRDPSGPLRFHGCSVVRPRSSATRTRAAASLAVIGGPVVSTARSDRPVPRAARSGNPESSSQDDPLAADRTGARRRRRLRRRAPQRPTRRIVPGMAAYVSSGAGWLRRIDHAATVQHRSGNGPRLQTSDQVVERLRRLMPVEGAFMPLEFGRIRHCALVLRRRGDRSSCDCIDGLHEQAGSEICESFFEPVARLIRADWRWQAGEHRAGVEGLHDPHDGDTRPCIACDHGAMYRRRAAPSRQQ